MFAIADYYIYCFLLRNNKYMDLVTCNALKLSMIMLLSNKHRSGMEKLNRHVVIVKKCCIAINFLSVPV